MAETNSASRRRAPLVAAVSRNCRNLGITADQLTQEKLATYAEELCRWNRRINLTGAKSPLQFINGPLFDAMTLIPVLCPASSFVDVGSGGGLPGIPAMLLYPLEKVALVEPRAKRAAFLRHVLSLLELSAAVAEHRIEALAPRTWSAAVAQAVFEPSDWLDTAPAYLEPNGVIYLLTSSPLPQMTARKVEADFVAMSPNGTKRYSYRVKICHD
jgi:16S rRNA (guanine527-N7)-methyltransferase